MTLREVVFESDGDTSASGAEVGGAARRLREREALEEESHQLFGFGTRDEDVGVDVDAAAAKRGVSDDVLYRAEFFQIEKSPVETQHVGLVDGFVAVEEKGGGVETEESLAEEKEERTGLVWTIERREVGGEAPLDVAEFV